MARPAAAALLACVALALVANACAYANQATKPGFCRTSAYTVDCATTQRIKLEMFKACGQGKILAVGKFVPNRNGCGCSVVQKVATPQDWDEFQKCQESLKNFEVLQDSRCKPGQAKGPC